MAHVAKWKEEEVKELADLMAQYPVVGILNMEGMPARQLQKMRGLLRGDVVIKMSKKSLMDHALEKAAVEERSLGDLRAQIHGQPAFIFSKINPFKLRKILVKNRAPAPIKGNSVAPKDVTVQKGETPFPPGPMLGELQQVGIPTAVAGGKITIKEDRVVARKGEKVSPKLAAILARLGIEPLEIGLDLVAAHEKGTIYLPEVLGVDEERVLTDLRQAYVEALNLSLAASYITKDNASIAVAKAFREARAVAVEANIFEPGIMGDILARSCVQMLSLASRLTEEVLDEELKEKVRARQVAKVEVKRAEKKAEKAEEKKSEEEAISGLGALFG